MERLTESSLLADSHADPHASGWFTDNVLHPFVNGTGVTQLYNNFVPEKEKAAPAFVPEAKTLSSEWAVHTLASASGAVLTYALAGKATGMALGAVSSAAGFEGATARALTSMTTAQIVGAGLYDFAKAPNAGETRLGNAAGSVAAFGLFSVGNEMLGASKTIANSTLLTGLGRVGVGMAGGLTSLETSHLVSKALGSKSELSWDDRIKAMASGGFINVAMPVVQKGVSTLVDGALNSKPFQLPADEPNAKLAAEARGQLPQLQIEEGPRGLARKMDLPDDLDSKARDLAPNARPSKPTGGDGEITKVILLKQQFDANARQAQIERVAGELADFIGQSKKSLDAAVYDFRLRDPKVESTVVNALNKAAESGVDVKLAFFQPPEKPAGKAFAHTAEIGGDAAPAEEPMSHGPSPELLAKLSPKIQVQHVAMSDAPSVIPDAFHDIVGDAKSSSPINPRLIDLQNGTDGSLDKGVGTQGITGGGKLMHDKYFVRDAGSKNASIWTGSTNITDDAFGSQDNNIIQIRSKALADVFTQDFKQMWDAGKIAGTGKDLHSQINVGDSQVTVAFSPGDGDFIAAEYARRIAAAKDTVHIASMVISSPEIMKALSDKIDAGLTVDGIYDGPQMAQIERTWGRYAPTSPASAEKLALWTKIKDNLVAKHSTPYSPDGPHDFMHNKVVSVDNQVVATGSFNMSKNATMNAENILVIENPTVATRYSTYIQDLIKTYGGSSRGKVVARK